MFVRSILSRVSPLAMRGTLVQIAPRFSPVRIAHPCRSFTRSGLRRNASEQQQQKQGSSSDTLATQRQTTGGALTVAERVVETGKDVGSLGVILTGFGLAGVFLYSVASELIFTSGPEDVFNQSAKRLLDEPEVTTAIGTDVKPVGGFRKENVHLQYAEYKHDGTDYLRMRYKVKGTYGQGIVQLEMKKDKSTGNKFKYRYFILDVAGASGVSRRLILEDNRSDDHSGDIAQ